ncbi:MAG TPA: hypothetical protein VFW07_16965 [Parafilimonas sp.]|nr:hypothetical protein [Parafilimonas sp.]
MPVKIVDTITKSLKGEIKADDLGKMIDDFKNQVYLTPKGGRTTIEPKEAWYVTKEQIDALFALNEKDGLTPTLLEINFAVHLTGQKDICENPLADSLTVVLRGTNDEKKPVNSGKEFVLIPGYSDFPGPGDDGQQTGVAGKGCCPSSRP